MSKSSRLLQHNAKVLGYRLVELAKLEHNLASLTVGDTEAMAEFFSAVIQDTVMTFANHTAESINNESALGTSPK